MYHIFRNNAVASIIDSTIDLVRFDGQREDFGNLRMITR